MTKNFAVKNIFIWLKEKESSPGACHRRPFPFCAYMKILSHFRSFSVFGTALLLVSAASVTAQDEKAEPPAPAPAEATPAPPATPAAPAEVSPSTPEPAAAPAPASSLETWLTQPSTTPAPAREEIEQFLTGLQQRQQDLSKTIDFLVSRKRLRQESAAKVTETISIPEDASLDHWDGIVRDQKEGKLNDKDFSDAVTAFAKKLRTVNTSQQTESLKLSKLMLQRSTDDDDAPVRHRARATTTTSAATTTPIPVMRAVPVHPPGKSTPPPAPASKPGTGAKPAAGTGNKAN